MWCFVVFHKPQQTCRHLPSHFCKRARSSRLGIDLKMLFSKMSKKCHERPKKSGKVGLGLDVLKRDSTLCYRSGCLQIHISNSIRGCPHKTDSFLTSQKTVDPGSQA